jgi:hypothetical protein
MKENETFSWSPMLPHCTPLEKMMVATSGTVKTVIPLSSRTFLT